MRARAWRVDDDHQADGEASEHVQRQEACGGLLHALRCNGSVEAAREGPASRPPDLPGAGGRRSRRAPPRPVPRPRRRARPRPRRRVPSPRRAGRPGTGSIGGGRSRGTERLARPSTHSPQGLPSLPQTVHLRLGVQQIGASVGRVVGVAAGGVDPRGQRVGLRTHQRIQRQSEVLDPAPRPISSGQVAVARGGDGGLEQAVDLLADDVARDVDQVVDEELLAGEGRGQLRQVSGRRRQLHAVIGIAGELADRRRRALAEEVRASPAVPPARRPVGAE